MVTPKRVLRVRDATGVTQDGAAFYWAPAAGGTVVSDFYPRFQALQAEGQWLPANCDGALCTGSSTPKGWEVSVDWANLLTTKDATVRRVLATDNNLASD